MKKVMIFLLLIAIIWVWYLKIPIYSSWIEDDFFSTKFIDIDSQSKKNWFILFKKHVEYIKKIDFDFKSKNIQRALLNEIKVYSELKKQKILKFDDNVWFKLNLLIYFEKDKIKYIEWLIKSWWAKKKLWIQLLNNSVKNNLFLLKNVEWNMLFINIFKSLIFIDIDAIRQLEKSKRVTKNDIINIKKIFSKIKIDNSIFEKSVKNEVNNKILLLNHYYWKESSKGKVDFADKILTFLFLNKGETKELYKLYWKQIIDLEFDKLILEEWYKNFIWKSSSLLISKNYKDQYKEFSRLIIKIDKIKKY